MKNIIKDFIEFIKVTIKPPRFKELDLENFGLNAFFNQPSLGSVSEQASDIKQMGVGIVRILFNWNDAVQNGENSPIDFSFYDDIENNLRLKNCGALVVLNGMPSWVKGKENPTDYFLTYIRKVVERYVNSSVILGYQIGNETNDGSEENKIYGFDKPENYAYIFKKACAIVRGINHNVIVTNSATTSVVQNFPNTIKYNRGMIDAGILDFVDVFSFHYYGDSYWNFYRPGGAYRFLKTINKEMWITEIGCNDVNRHKSYAFEKIGYLREKFHNISIVLWYQYDGGGYTMDYGLLPANSELYKYLKTNGEK